LFTKGELEVNIGVDRSSFVFRSIYVIGLYRFVQIVYVEVFGVVLVNKQTSSATVDEDFDGLFIRANFNGNGD
jgi:hypothetical protein